MSYAQNYKSSWWGYIGKRVLISIALFFVLSFGIFYLANTSTMFISFTPITSPEQHQELLRLYGMPEPTLAGYYHWMTGIFRGDFGEAYNYYLWLTRPSNY